jgi:hypothetical protein
MASWSTRTLSASARAVAESVTGGHRADGGVTGVDLFVGDGDGVEAQLLGAAAPVGEMTGVARRALPADEYAVREGVDVEGGHSDQAG